ncbi:MAG: hypothetical protein RR326_10245, partial [Stenotrophomonas sp.]
MAKRYGNDTISIHRAIAFGRQADLRTFGGVTSHPTVWQLLIQRQTAALLENLPDRAEITVINT